MKHPIRGSVLLVCLTRIPADHGTSVRAELELRCAKRRPGRRRIHEQRRRRHDREQRPYRAIVLPFGLFQVLPNLPKLDPTKDEFDLVRAIEYTASPIHYIIGRDNTNTASAFITDLRNGELSRDLNVYRGFSPATDVSAEGLASPNWGHTFKFKKATTARSRASTRAPGSTFR